jgi:phosphatidylinositol alpha-1,6-mannosyltransferase
VVVAPSIGYYDGLPLIGWREHDRQARYKVFRLPLLRTVMQDADVAQHPVRRFRFLVADLLIRLNLVWTILRLARREGCTSVCVGELLANDWLLPLLRKTTRMRLVVYVHGEEITTDDPYDSARTRMRRALREAQAIVVVSRFTREAVRAVLGDRHAGRVTLIENGVDCRRFVPGPKRPDLVERYGLAESFVFVSVCRLLEKKGIDYALRAFAPIAARDAQARFLIVGDGPYRAHLEALVAELDLVGRVVFTGQVEEPDLVDCYRLGDVFVMPNRELPNGDTEGFGLVFLEANGCGLPAIAGRDGGSTDAVTDGLNGLVVDGHSVSAIAEAMCRLHRDPDLRARLSAGALETAARADWAEKTRAFLAVCANPNGSSRRR